MLKITPTLHEKFKKLQSIKDTPGEVEKKLYKKVYRFVPILRYIPGIHMIGVCNSLSMNACHRDSDIDLFVVTAKNRIWTVRVLLTIYFTMLGLRKNNKKHAGRFCLSFFITENAINLKKIALKKDIYLYHWILFMKPIINKGNTYEKFIQENSLWCDFSDKQDILLLSKNTVKTIYHPDYQGKFFTSFGNIIEKMLKTLLLPKTKKSFQKLGKPFGVIITDDMLKFHDQDKRKDIQTAV